MSRRVVVLSSVDRARVARGELTQAAAQQARARQTDALTQARARADTGNEHANDARLLRELPPHWGRQ